MKAEAELRKLFEDFDSELNSMHLLPCPGGPEGQMEKAHRGC